MPQLKTKALFVWVAVLAAVAPAADDERLPRDTLPAELPIGAIPLGLSEDLHIPADNPLTPAKVKLGRKLFFDPILSKDGTVSCATCHQPNHGFAGSTAVARGIGGHVGTRNAPSLLNRAFGKTFFWDGRESSLETQSLQPIASPSEMGDSVDAAVARLKSNKGYDQAFGQIFADGATAQNLAKALASFERVLLTGGTRVDRFRAGEIGALNDVETHGVWLFESRGGCWRCHTGANFTDEDFHNTGVSWGKTPQDLGRFSITKRQEDAGRFKTPTLRGLVHTGPYMHDGSMATLEEVVDFYNKGGGKNPHLDAAVGPLSLTKEESKALVAFLKALTEEPRADRDRGKKNPK